MGLDNETLKTRFRSITKNAYNIDEALKRQNLKRENIELLREKLHDAEKVPKFLVDNQLLLFLNSCDGDVDKAAEKVKNFYEVKASTPEFFKDRDINSDAIQDCLKNLAYVSLPITPDNNNLILHKLISTNAKDYNFDDAVKTYIMVAESYAFRNGPRSGTIFIDDLRGASISHLFRPSISSLRKGLKFLQEGSPLNVKAIHIMNTVPFINMIISIVKPYLRSEMLNKIHFHSTNMDYEEFYEKFIPKSHLPSDYGGDLESIEELHEKQKKAFMDMRDYFILEENQASLKFDQYANAYDEKRKSDQKNDEK